MKGELSLRKSHQTLAGLIEVPNNGVGGHVGDIFISHVEENSGLALKIADGLESAGYSTWYYERDSLPGPSYLLQTAREIERSKAVVLIISPHSLGSHQVTKEVIRAHESGKPFIPILSSISHVEFGNRQPEWREAVGSATSISVPKAGVATILPRVIEGIRGLGILPSDSATIKQSQPLGEYRTFEYSKSHAPFWDKLSSLSLWQKIAIGVGLILILAAAAAKGVSMISSKQTGAQTSTGNNLLPTPELSHQVATSTTPDLDAATTPIQTSQGPLLVSLALLTTEACPPPEIPEQCRKASGSNRFLVLTLRAAEGGDVTLTQTFTTEANASVVSFEGRRAGASSVYFQESLARLQVVYGMLPANSIEGKVLLRWPDNPPLKLLLKT